MWTAALADWSAAQSLFSDQQIESPQGKHINQDDHVLTAMKQREQGNDCFIFLRLNMNTSFFSFLFLL